METQGIRGDNSAMIIPFTPRAPDVARAFAERQAAMQAGYRAGLEAAARIVESAEKPGDAMNVALALQLLQSKIRRLSPPRRHSTASPPFPTTLED